MAQEGSTTFEQEPAEEKLPTEEEMAQSIETAGAEARVSPLDPDFFLILLFALIVDGVDILLLILQIFTVFTIGEAVTIATDIINFIVIGGWIHWRTGRIVQSKKDQQKNLVEYAERLRKKGVAVRKANIPLARTKSPIRRALMRGGIAVLGEIAPIVGVIPFWSIAVISTMREK